MANFKVTIDGAKFPPVFKIEAEGFKGGSCIGQTDEIQEILRMETQRQTLKPEFKEVRQKLPMRR